MIYIVCYLHGILFWLGYGVEPLNSLSLIATTQFFFVAGVAFRYTHSKRLIDTLKNRFKRVLLPWYIYSFVTLLLLTTFAFVRHHSLIRYTLSDFLNILITADIPYSPMMCHNWFIIPYLVVACTFCIQLSIIEKFNIRGGIC